jgi:hypothetical protein
MPDGPEDDKKKRPPVKARLTSMHTESVHAVPAGANLRNVALILKADQKDETMADGAADGAATGEGKQDEPGEGLELSTASKELLLTGITDLVEKLTGLGEAVGAAAINEEAVVPEEVLLVLQGCSDSTAALVQQASPPAPPAPPAAADAAETAAAAEAEAAKQADATETEVTTEKAGAMLSKKNLGIIRNAIDALTKLAEAAEKEKADDKADKKTAKGDATAAPADDAPAGDPAPESEPTVAEQVSKALDAGLAPLLARFDDQAANVAKAIKAKDAAAAAKDEQIAKMAAQANAPQQPNSSEPEGGGGNDVAPAAGVPHNLSDWVTAEVAKEAAQQG